ncbi:MAG: hypothetical protein EHM64_02000 [Ignavibacteriae bacterium]|nr:MAG: hypothetical protein EHM64_02000 [Ignavibacteriota bacterium]
MFFFIIVLSCIAPGQTKTIDRFSLVQRHHVVNTSFDTLASLSVGNGEFAYTVDATGLQTFPEFYKNGIPLGTQSQWGWHSFPNDSGYTLDEVTKQYPSHEHSVFYPVEWTFPERKTNAARWLRQNPHRLHLGIVGFEILKSNGEAAVPNDIKGIHQSLDLWSGTMTSAFLVEHTPVHVMTICHPDLDMISTRVVSRLVSSGRLNIMVRFPYPTGLNTDWACAWNQPKKHTSKIVQQSSYDASIERILDSTTYYVYGRWNERAEFKETGPHSFRLQSTNSDTLTFSCRFSPDAKFQTLPDIQTTLQQSVDHWKEFWMSGGAVDFSGSTDPRAYELERRIVLSQYLLRIQCAGSLPPQETGLTYNSWFGKFHLEMHWWHAVHNVLWGRTDLFEKSMQWYTRIIPAAFRTAQRQGFAGCRWPKMTDPSGRESPSNIGPFLIWQQPHPIYYAELFYRALPTEETLQKYKNLVLPTAEFMASYMTFDSLNRRYRLGPMLIPAQERFDPARTINPSFELAYWYWGLSTAQRWRERLNLPRDRSWDSMLDNISSLPKSNGTYLAAESAPDSYVNPLSLSDHPSVLGAYGFLPWSRLIDTSIMRTTLDTILNHWNWSSTWGWDYPLMTMTAVRLGMPDRAIDILLKDTQKNTYLKNGHNYQDRRLRVYLPGNGGLLTAVAMMCAGFDGSQVENPGIPKNKNWVVRWEGLHRME